VDVAQRSRPEELAVGLEEADREEERPVVGALQNLHRQRGDGLDARGRDLHHPVEADHLRPLGD
jgi:hypothetical protein